MEKKAQVSYQHIAIEGMMRAGKSKLAKILTGKLGGRVVFDTVENPYIKDFYDEKEGAAFLTQLVFLVSRYHQQMKLAQRELFEERVVCDYLFEKDKIYAYQTLSDDELLVYERIFTILSERIVKPDLTIYLQISLDTLIKRIARKGTALEKSISERYLQDILEAFDYFFFNYQATPLLVVKADDLDFNRDEDIMDLIHQMNQIKKGPQYYVPLSRADKDTPKR